MKYLNAFVSNFGGIGLDDGNTVFCIAFLGDKIGF
jgi:hypothetical protein